MKPGQLLPLNDWPLTSLVDFNLRIWRWVSQWFPCILLQIFNHGIGKATASDVENTAAVEQPAIVRSPIENTGLIVSGKSSISF
jgi:hypothetical protein